MENSKLVLFQKYHSMYLVRYEGVYNQRVNTELLIYEDDGQSIFYVALFLCSFSEVPL